MRIHEKITIAAGTIIVAIMVYTLSIFIGIATDSLVLSIRERVRLAIDKQFSLQISYENLDPGILDGAYLTDVLIRSSLGETTFARVDRMVITYDLWDLIVNSDPDDPFKIELLLTSPHVTIDDEIIAGIAQNYSPEAPSTGSSFFWDSGVVRRRSARLLDPILIVKVEDASLTYRTEGLSRIYMDGGSFIFQGGFDAITSLDGEASSLSLSLDDLPFDLGVSEYLSSTRIDILDLRYSLLPLGYDKFGDQSFSINLSLGSIAAQSTEGQDLQTYGVSLLAETSLQRPDHFTIHTDSITFRTLSTDSPELPVEGEVRATSLQADISRIEDSDADYHIELLIPKLDLSVDSSGQTADLSMHDIEAELDLIGNDIYDVTITTSTITTETALLLGPYNGVSPASGSVQAVVASQVEELTEVYGSFSIFSPTLQVFKNPSRATFHILTRADVLKAEAYTQGVTITTDVDFVTLFIETDFTRIIDISMLASRAKGSIEAPAIDADVIEGTFSTANIDLYIQNTEEGTSIDLESAVTATFSTFPDSRLMTPFSLSISSDQNLSSLGFSLTLPDASFNTYQIPGVVSLEGSYERYLGGTAYLTYDNLKALLSYEPSHERLTGDFTISGLTSTQLGTYGLDEFLNPYISYVSEAQADISVTIELLMQDIDWRDIPYTGKILFSGVTIPEIEQQVSGSMVIEGTGPDFELGQFSALFGDVSLEGVAAISLAPLSSSGYFSIYLSDPDLGMTEAVSIDFDLIDNRTLDFDIASEAYAPGIYLESTLILDGLAESSLAHHGSVRTPYGVIPFVQTIDIEDSQIEGSLFEESLSYTVTTSGLSGEAGFTASIVGTIDPSVGDFAEHIPILTSIGRFKIDTEISVRDKDDYLILIHELMAIDIEAGNTTSTIALTGTIIPGLFDLTRFDISSGKDILTGSSVGEFDLFEELRLDAEISLFGSGNESYKGYIRILEGEIISDLSMISGNLARLGISGLQGAIDGIISFRDPADLSPDLSAIVTIREGRYDGNRYEGLFDISASDSMVRIIDSSVSFAGFDLDALSLSYVYDRGEITGEADLSLDTRTGNLTFSFDLDARIAQLDDIMDLTGEFIRSTPLNTSIQVSDIITNDKVLMEGFSLTTILQDGSLMVFGGPQDGVELSITKGGRVKARIDGERLPVSLTLDGSINQGLLHLETHDVHFDLSFLNTLLNISEYLVFEQGDIYGDLLITGPIDDPDIFGEIFCDSALLSSSVVSFPIIVQGVSATISEKSVQFAPFYGSIQNTYVEMNMISELESLIPYFFKTTLTIPTNMNIPIRLEIKDINLKLEGSVTGTVSFTGDGSSPLQIDGDIRLQDSIISINPNMFNTTRVPPEKPLATDLHITTGKNVSVVLPSIELPIVSATISENRTLDIVYESLRNTYSVDGVLDILGGEIFYFQRSFFITEGRLLFNENQVSSFDPSIQLRARLRDFDRNGDKVDIYLIIDNQPLKSYTPRFESKPSKTLSEIAGILGQNILPAGIVSNTDLSSAFALATIATDVFQQLGFITIDPISDFERLLRNTLNLDLFSIRTQLLQNILLDTFPLSIGQSVSINPIARYLDNTTVFLGKYVSDEFFLQAMLHLSTQSANGFNLFWTNDLWLDLEFSVEWENPFFDVSLATQPRGVSPGDILDSLTIGVSWRYAF